MHVAVIGADINGLCVAWELARAGAGGGFRARFSDGAYQQRIVEAPAWGLRYLENGALRLVGEALQERRASFEFAPDLAHPPRLALPIYQGARREKRWLGLGLAVYDLLALEGGRPGHQWLGPAQVRAEAPTLKHEGQVGAHSLWDRQTEDWMLGLRVTKHVRSAGAVVYEEVPVLRLEDNGNAQFADGQMRGFDRIDNTAGPWAHAPLRQSRIESAHALDLIRGSYIVVGRPASGSLTNDILERFASLRPLVASIKAPERATREYAIELYKRVITVFGGKWTTARALARKVRKVVEQQ